MMGHSALLGDSKGPSAHPFSAGSRAAITIVEIPIIFAHDYK
jgi:hypothetical protein